MYSFVCNTNFVLKGNPILHFGFVMFYFSNNFFFFFELEVYTCASDAAISQFLPTSLPKFQYSNENVSSYELFE